MRLGTELTFDAAHRLSFHKGKCKNLHGHTWKLEVLIDVPDEDYNDIVVDFNAIKQLITGRFDHKVLISETDDVLYGIIFGKFEAEILPCETTVENLALLIKNLIAQCFSIAMKNIQITLYETPKNYVRC